MAHRMRSRTAKVALSETVDHRMKSYAVAAAAAGVSMLALAQPAEAEVVVTRAHLIPTQNNPIAVDLNKDGIADFQFSLGIYNSYGVFAAYLNVLGLTGGKVVGSPGPHFPYASALLRRTKIGPSAHFSSRAVTVERSLASSHFSRRTYGKWGGNPTNRFLGVKFLIDGATHFGWVRLTVVSTQWPISATITGYAYETIPNKPIPAGVSGASSTETNTEERVQSSGRAYLGMLALGADGLALWRRNETLPY